MPLATLAIGSRFVVTCLFLFTSIHRYTHIHTPWCPWDRRPRYPQFSLLFRPLVPDGISVIAIARVRRLQNFCLNEEFVHLKDPCRPSGWVRNYTENNLEWKKFTSRNYRLHSRIMLWSLLLELWSHKSNLSRKVITKVV